MRRPVPLARFPDDWRNRRGLEEQDAAARFACYGPNHVVEPQAHRFRDLARDTARDPMIWFLVVTGLIYAALGEWTESVTLLVSITPLVGMDAYLHRRTAASIAGLAVRLAESARVERDGQLADLPASMLVPGDLALVPAGQWFPADGIIVDGEELQVDEAILSGESSAVRKHVCPTLSGSGSEPPVDAEHWAFAGTRLLTGQAWVRIAFTGRETLYGEIVRTAVAGSHERTPLQSAIDHLVSVLVVAASVFCLLLGLARWWQGHGLADAALSALTLGIAAFPEEFPVVFAFFLGFGVHRLARRQALVRRAVSVENIGRVSTILSDKTGTVTEGRLSLTHFIGGAGVDRNRLLDLSATASRIDSGDPLDEAIFAEAHGLATRKPLATFPFTEGRRRETAAVRGDDGSILYVTKGAAETVLSMCANDVVEAEHWRTEAARLASEGHKVIACAWQQRDASSWDGTEPIQGYRFAGLLAFEDPVREGVRDAVASCRGAGIRVILVTGDHPGTAAAVAREIGLAAEPTVISGDEMTRRLKGSGATALEGVDVVARAVPAQKLELVRAMQDAGESVAVTGDGVNDVPALQAADIGIAMGERGSRSAREVAAIVLLDDNLRTIVSAILEGRQLFLNLQSSFRYLLMIHLPLVLSAALIPLAGYPILYLPIHIVWIELVIHPTALLAFQGKPAPLRFQRTPVRRGRGFFSSAEWRSIVIVGLYVTAIVIAAHMIGIEWGGGRDERFARSVSLLCLILSSVAMTAAATRFQTRSSRWLCAAVVVLSVLTARSSLASTMLHMSPLSPGAWLATMAAATSSGLVCFALLQGGSHEGEPNSGADRLLAPVARGS